MRVRVDKAARVAYQGQVLDLVAGEEITGLYGEYLATTGAPVTVLDEDQKPKPKREPKKTAPPAGSADGADAAAATGEAKPVDTGDGDQAPPAPEGLDITKPIGDVLAWVGTDPVRAGQALQAEQAKADQARAALVAKLTALAGQ